MKAEGGRRKDEGWRSKNGDEGLELKGKLRFCLSSFIPRLHPSSLAFILHPSSFILHPSAFRLPSSAFHLPPSSVILSLSSFWLNGQNNCESRAAARLGHNADGASVVLDCLSNNRQA